MQRATMAALVVTLALTQAFRLAPRRSVAVARSVVTSSPLTSASSSSRLTTTRLFSAASDNTVVGRCTQKITDALKPTKIVVTATNDDPNGDHIQILCISNEFEGKNMVARQRLVYKAIWDELSGPVHAVDAIIAKVRAQPHRTSSTICFLINPRC